MAQSLFATMKISDPATNNIYWYRLKDVKRSSESGTHAYMAWTGPTSQTLASAYGMKDDNQLWCIVDDPNSNGYLLYNKAAGFSAALRRGYTKDQLMQNNGNDRGYSAFITPNVTPDGYKGEPFLFTTSGKPTEKAFALTYYRDRWQYPSSNYVGTFGKTANGGFNFNVSGQEVQIMWFESEPAGQLDNTDLDYYPLINAKGTVGGLTKEAVRELERLHVQLINDFNDANVQAVKAEAAKLRATSERVPLDPNKYYYIRSAHLGFFGPKEIDANSDNDVAGKGTWKKPVIYVDATDSKMKWRLSTNSDDELWQVIVTNGTMASGTIQLKNKATGKYFSIWDASSTPNSAYPPNIRDVNTAIYPGHSQVWIQAENYSAHAENHLLGEGTGGNMTGYDAPDADPSDESVNSPYNYKRSNNAYLPGASVWLFEPSTVEIAPVNPLTEQEKIDVRRLIWGSGKPGGITSENIATLVNLWNNGNPTNPNAVRTEFDRLIKLPMDQRVPFESGYYRIKNGHDAFNINNKTARLYENASGNTPDWKTSDTGNEAIYYLNKK
ncbi:MAG: hypothetical protein SOY99_01365, partial [Alloprevotella sp.]|nr:hypothetical protein [Alloprevotella sp.]